MEVNLDELRALPVEQRLIRLIELFEELTPHDAPLIATLRKIMAESEREIELLGRGRLPKREKEDNESLIEDIVADAPTMSNVPEEFATIVDAGYEPRFDTEVPYQQTIYDPITPGSDQEGNLTLKYKKDGDDPRMTEKERQAAEDRKYTRNT
ncbi:hypothetical protein GF342_05720 [Candidatus Woesearchaeota archaeon]|nr:hypothetical protein [Candidatus Woesearchaeota archaeon]